VPRSVFAIDWSGAATNAAWHIWLAEAIEPGHLVRLECGRDRGEMAHYLLSQTDPLVIGFDFAFAVPAWFAETLGVRSAPELWAYVAVHGETWLSACEPPFWGRRGRPRPDTPGPAFRKTELAAPSTAGVLPKSIFQIGGAGTVGTGSIRGMPLLHQLRCAGATIWPFTRCSSPTVVEIYPRLLTGAVRKSSSMAREGLLSQRYPNLAAAHARLAVASEDAFDAAVSALVMIEHLADLAALPPEADPDLRLEGRIWHPAWRAEAYPESNDDC